MGADRNISSGQPPGILSGAEANVEGNFFGEIEVSKMLDATIRKTEMLKTHGCGWWFHCGEDDFGRRGIFAQVDCSEIDELPNAA